GIEQKTAMAVACMDNTVLLIDRKYALVMGTFAGHKCENYRIQCSTNGRLVASGSEDGYVYIWDALAKNLGSSGCVQHMSR
ncbi:hypothetical protein FB639_006503, partial [Coemansia asiatica]